MHGANQNESLPIDYETGYPCDTNRFSVMLERVTPNMGLLVNRIKYEPHKEKPSCFLYAPREVKF